VNIKINNGSKSNTVTHLNLFIRNGIFISNLSYTLDHEIQVVSFNIYLDAADTSPQNLVYKNWSTV